MAPALAEVEAELAVPPFPMAFRYLWDHYGELRVSKSPGVNGHDKIEWLDLQAYMWVTKARLYPWEARLLRAIDDIFIRSTAEAREGTDAEREAAARDDLAAAGKGHVVVKSGRGGQ